MNTLSLPASFRNRAVFAAACGALALLLAPGRACAQAAANAEPTLGNTFLFAPPKEAGQVLSHALRDKLLKADAQNLDRANPAIEQRLLDAPNPFYRPVPVIVPGGETSANTTTVPEPVVQLTDADRLRQVADKLQATGRMVVGGRGLLQSPGQNHWAVGQVVEVRFPNEAAPAKILLVSVENAGYTLKLNDTSLLFPYLARPPSGRPASVPAAAPDAPAPPPAAPPAAPPPAAPGGK